MIRAQDHVLFLKNETNNPITSVEVTNSALCIGENREKVLLESGFVQTGERIVSDDPTLYFIRFSAYDMQYPYIDVVVTLGENKISKTLQYTSNILPEVIPFKIKFGWFARPDLQRLESHEMELIKMPSTFVVTPESFSSLESIEDTLEKTDENQCSLEVQRAE